MTDDPEDFALLPTHRSRTPLTSGGLARLVAALGEHN
jgi:hypothetical protein